MLERRAWLGLVALLASGCGLIIGLKDRELIDGGADAAPPFDVTPLDAPPADSGVDAGCPPDASFTDDDNCGRCGHACLGGHCSNGKCSAVTVCTAPENVSTLAVDSQNVYWGSSNGASLHVGSCPLGDVDAGANSLYAAASDIPSTMAVGGGTLFWAEKTSLGVYSIPVDGGTELTLAPTAAPAQVLVDNGNLYWCDVSSNSTVYTCPLSGGCPSANPVTSSIASGVQSIFILGSSTLYFGTASAPYHLYVCALSLCSSMYKDMMLGNYDPYSLAASATNVYVADTGQNVIVVCSSGSCAPDGGTQLTGPLAPGSLAIDGTNLYWVDHGSDVRFTPLPVSGPAQVLASGNVQALTEDALAVYYDDGPNVMKVAKP